jgi:hypothetical protein
LGKGATAGYTSAEGWRAESALAGYFSAKGWRAERAIARYTSAEGWKAEGGRSEGAIARVHLSREMEGRVRHTLQERYGGEMAP